MARCWVSFDDDQPITYDCELDLGHRGWHVAHVDTSSEWGVLTWDVKPGYRLSQGREGDDVGPATP